MQEADLGLLISYALGFVSIAKGQLWRLLVVASVDPSLWAEKGTDEGELVDVEARQLDGLEI